MGRFRCLLKDQNQIGRIHPIQLSDRNLNHSKIYLNGLSPHQGVFCWVKQIRFFVKILFIVFLWSILRIFIDYNQMN